MLKVMLCLLKKNVVLCYIILIDEKKCMDLRKVKGITFILFVFPMLEVMLY